MVVGLDSHFTLYHHEKWLVKQSPLLLRKSAMSQLIASKSPCHIPSYDLLCILYILSYCIPIVYCIHSYMYIYICTHDIFYVYIYISYTVLFFSCGLWSKHYCEKSSKRLDTAELPASSWGLATYAADETWHWELITP